MSKLNQSSMNLYQTCIWPYRQNKQCFMLQVERMLYKWKEKSKQTQITDSDGNDNNTTIVRRVQAIISKNPCMISWFLISFYSVFTYVYLGKGVCEIFILNSINTSLTFTTYHVCMCIYRYLPMYTGKRECVKFLYCSV